MLHRIAVAQEKFSRSFRLVWNCQICEGSRLILFDTTTKWLQLWCDPIFCFADRTFQSNAQTLLYTNMRASSMLYYTRAFSLVFFCVRNQNEIRWMWVGYMLCYLCNGWTAVNRYGHIFGIRCHTYNSYFALNICHSHFTFRYEFAVTHTISWTYANTPRHGNVFAMRFLGF